jgi:hypothetical protein
MARSLCASGAACFYLVLNVKVSFLEFVYVNSLWGDDAMIFWRLVVVGV